MLNIFIFFLFLFTFPFRQCADDNLIAPPEIESKIGYLTVAKNVALPPVSERLFILPQIDLLILEENDDAYMLVYPAKNYSTACVVPKYAKYTTIMIKDSAKKKLSFRGGLEVDTMELVLRKGEELSVKKKVKGGYIAMVRCNNQDLPFFVPDDLEGIEFKKESAFAKFAKSQNAKGLKYFNGTWMPADKVALLMEKNRKLDENKLFIWQNLIEGAKSGFVVLKDKKVLHGKLQGNDSTHILFAANGRDYWLGIDDVEPLDVKIILERGKVDTAQILLSKAQKLMQSDLGLAKKNLQDALSFANDNISGKDSYAAQIADSTLKESLSLFKQIDARLKEHNEVIYDYAVFPKYVVDYHLEAGDMLLKRKFWIKPNQCCGLCKTKGQITCTLCLGKGVTSKNCPACEGTGKVKCPICEGTGWRECNICGGKGYIYQKSRSSTFFVGTSCYYPSYWRPGRVVTSGRNIAVIGPSPVFCGPYFGGGTFMEMGNPDQAIKKVCWQCGGTGTLQCPKTRKCMECKGSGLIFEICIKCHGRKKLECPDCHGKGFIGKVQEVPKPVKTRWVVP